ncbi:placenta-expressed transcript 1 protein-like [Pelobates fuscus]|uniref:placenta-expressed transcript 1 protein-like n=1 Tax=Pelobates fuscus TaxID=191477 RepID=UPI002FE4F55C
MAVKEVSAFLFILSLVLFPKYSTSNSTLCNPLPVNANIRENILIDVNPTALTDNTVYTVHVTFNGTAISTLILEALSNDSRVGNWQGGDCVQDSGFVSNTSIEWTSPANLSSVTINAFIITVDGNFTASKVLNAIPPTAGNNTSNATTAEPGTVGNATSSVTTAVPGTGNTTTVPGTGNTTTGSTTTATHTTSTGSATHPSSMLMALIQTFGLFVITSRLLS